MTTQDDRAWTEIDEDVTQPIQGQEARLYDVYRRVNVQRLHTDDLYFSVGYRLAAQQVPMETAIQVATQVVADEFPRSSTNGELLAETGNAGFITRLNVLHHSDERYSGAQFPLVAIRLARPLHTGSPNFRETLKASYWRR